MKKVISILALGLALLMVSCQKENTSSGSINEITDLYTVPADAVPMAELTASKSTWSTDRRYFDLTFGSALSTTLVGYDALLTPGQYILGADEIGKAILAKTKLNGQAAKEGYITVGKLPDGKYAITAHIDGQVLAWTGTLPFVEDPAPLNLTVLQQASSNKDSKLVTMQLAEAGVAAGAGKYFAVDLYSEDGYLHDGAYTASAAGGQVNAGEFGIGWDPGDIYDIGWAFTDWGTCLWTVSGETSTAEKITDGLVTVTSREEKVDGKDVTIWTIFWGVKYPKEVLFEGAIPTLTKPKKPAGSVTPTHKYEIGEPQPCSTQDNNVVEGVKKYPVTIKDANDEEVAYLEFVLADGSDDVVEGEYVSTEYAHEAGQLANGYFMDFGDWGTFAGGSYYIDGGEKVYIDPGVTVIVTQIGTGAFSFTGPGFDYPAAGPNYVPGGDVADALPAVDEITDNGNGVDKHSITIGGDTVVAYFELLTATGTDIEGSFVSTEYAAEAGMLCNGWEFPDWGIGGGSYVMKGEVKEYVAPGVTVEVTKLADSIYKFTGPDYEFVANISK